MLNEDIMAYMTKNIDKKNKETNEVKGKIELQPQKPYFAFEIREDKKLK